MITWIKLIYKQLKQVVVKTRKRTSTTDKEKDKFNISLRISTVIKRIAEVSYELRSSTIVGPRDSSLSIKSVMDVVLYDCWW